MYLFQKHFLKIVGKQIDNMIEEEKPEANGNGESLHEF